jgi:hypothetical protein
MMTAKVRSMVLLGGIMALVPFIAAPADMGRAYVAGNYAVDIQDVGKFWLKSYEGSNASAPPVTHGQRPDQYPNKEPGPVRYEEATLQIPIGAPKGLWDWATQFAGPKGAAPKQVTISTLDYTMTERSRRILSNTAISAVELPACDGSSKEAAYATIKLMPGAVREETPPANTKAAATPTNDATKAWLASNFRLTIDGVDATRVNKIDPIVIKRTATGPDYANLKISFAEVSADSWKRWAAQTLPGSGPAADSKNKPERNGKLELLSPAQQVLLTVNFDGLGVVQLIPDAAEANADQIKRITAELYVEKITLVGK